MYPVAVLAYLCLLSPTPAGVPAGNGAKEARGLVLEVYADNLLLISVGEDDHAQYGDEFSLGSDGDATIGLFVGESAVNRKPSGKIVSLGKRFSVAKVYTTATNKDGFRVGDVLRATDWDQRRLKKESQSNLDNPFYGHDFRGGALIIKE
jgi:hypothetical protein